MEGGTHERLRIAGVSGSLRKDSFNTALLHAVAALGIDDLDLDIVTLEDVPLFNEDVERVGWPPRVQALRDRLEPARGIVFATPEYNYSIPGVLKNAIDLVVPPRGRGADLR